MIMDMDTKKDITKLIELIDNIQCTNNIVKYSNMIETQNHNFNSFSFSICLFLISIATTTIVTTIITTIANVAMKLNKRNIVDSGNISFIF